MLRLLKMLFAFKKQQNLLVEAKDKFNYDTYGILLSNGATMNVGVTAGEPAKLSP